MRPERWIIRELRSVRWGLALGIAAIPYFVAMTVLRCLQERPGWAVGHAVCAIWCVLQVLAQTQLPVVRVGRGVRRAACERSEASWRRRILDSLGLFRVGRRQSVYLWCPGCDHDLWAVDGAYRHADGAACVYRCECGTWSTWLPGPGWVLLSYSDADPTASRPREAERLAEVRR